MCSMKLSRALMCRRFSTMRARSASRYGILFVFACGKTVISAKSRSVCSHLIVWVDLRGCIGIFALHFGCIYCLLFHLQRYRPMSAGAWTLLRHTLARFFQDRKVKVSIFLQDGIQLGDGSFNLSCTGALPVVTATPGSIRFVFLRTYASLVFPLFPCIPFLIDVTCMRRAYMQVLFARSCFWRAACRSSECGRSVQTGERV